MYVRGVMRMTRNAGTASPKYFQLIPRTLRTMSAPTITRAPPEAQEGMLEKIGAKKTETRKANPVVIAVIPVLPPSVIP